MRTQSDPVARTRPPFDGQAALDRAIRYHLAGRVREAGEIYAEILRRDPHNPYAIHSMGVLAMQAGKDELAFSYLMRAIEINPADPVFHNNLGLVFGKLGEAEKAVEHFQRAVSLNPDYPEALHNLGNMLKDLCRPPEAIECQQRAIALRPDYAEAHFNRALSLLLSGNFRDGLEEFEWRWHLKGFKPRGFAKPLWDGSDLSGKTILLHAEQGLGDTMQFIRYGKIARERGGTLIAAVQDPLIRLLKSCDFIDSLISWKDDLPPFDVQAPLMSLPRLLNTTPETIPAEIPYIVADSGLTRYWGDRLAQDGNFKIGLCWQASSLYEKHHRRKTISPKSIPLNKFRSLERREGISLYSLQKDIPAEKPADRPIAFLLHEFGPDFDNEHGAFMDSAALMKNLDLVITIDTSVAHLAGALGVPVWVLLPYVPDWRWFLDRSDSPWYPTMRLFRQPRARDWDSVVKEVEEALSGTMASATGREEASRSTTLSGGNGSSLEVEVSVGEFIDKLVILEIKAARVTDPQKLKNVFAELDVLRAVYEKRIPKSARLDELVEELRDVNNRLWDIEDAVRDKERHKTFDQEFVELARSVYFNNDHRAEAKRKINELLGSRIVEEKSYAAY